MNLHITDDLHRYFTRTHSKPEVARQIWTRPLIEYSSGAHVPMDGTVGDFKHLEYRLFLELCRRIALIPPRGTRGAGKAFVHLACNLAATVHIPDQYAMRVLAFAYYSLDKNPPIMDPTSFRVVKNRITPAA